MFFNDVGSDASDGKLATIAGDYPVFRTTDATTKLAE